ncbi:hypothetical protein R1sor_013886 [Riccia sorocarpa]|uniref:catechol O-methyltransferase n=1 Tax=Riccia sorocarpa TaxID=122646 RepID=A0ABD3HAG7_9MARC
MAPEILSRLWTFFTQAIKGKDGTAGDGREKLVLKSVLEDAEKNPESVIKTIDKFASRCWLMNIGDDKGQLLDKAVGDRKPKVVLELGAYIGYSAVRISSQLEEGAKLISLEMNPANASTVRQVVEHAGLSDKVVVVEGILEDKIGEIKRLVQEMNAEIIDFVFIDHEKRYYLLDILLLKENGLIGKGTVLFADNMKLPGSQEYREYVSNKEVYDTVEHNTCIEYMRFLPDSVIISTLK